MKIAVTSQNLRTVTGHAGRARRFLIFEAQPEAEPVKVARLDLPKEMCMHEFHGSEPHPLDDMDVILSASFGDGFARRMARKGIRVAATTQDEPAAAVHAFLTAEHRGETTPPAVPTPAGTRVGAEHKHRHQHQHGCGCGCGGSHPL